MTELDPRDLLRAERAARRARLTRELDDMWNARESGEDVHDREARFDLEFADLVADALADQLMRRLTVK